MDSKLWPKTNSRLRVEFSSNGRASDNTVGYFKNIMSLHDYEYKLDRMNACISELRDDIMECNAMEYNRRYDERQHKIDRFERFKSNNGKPIIG